jgi:hypothetical protein
MRRKSFRRKSKKQKRKSRKNYKGGQPQVFNETEGVVEVFPEKVIKNYKNKQFFDKELEGYEIFNYFDPSFEFHPQGAFDENELKLEMENVGETVDSDMSQYIIPYTEFLIYVLNLNDDTFYLLHEDGHANNVCIKNGQVKYIDLGSVTLIDGNDIVNEEIIDDFKKIFSIFIKLDFSLNRIIDNLEGRTYSQAILILTNYLENFLRNIDSYWDEIDSLPKVKRGNKEIKEAERPTKDRLSLNLDSTSEEESPSKPHSINLFGDD